MRPEGIECRQGTIGNTNGAAVLPREHFKSDVSTKRQRLTQTSLRPRPNVARAISWIAAAVAHSAITALASTIWEASFTGTSGATDSATLRAFPKSGSTPTRAYSE